MGLFNRRKKTETEKARARGKSKSKRQVAKARVQRGASKGSRNLVYILDQAPLFKIAGLGLALYGINKIINAIEEAFEDEDVNDDPIDTPVKPNLTIPLKIYYNPDLGDWEEDTFAGLFNDDKYWTFIGASGRSSTIPPISSNQPTLGSSKTISNYAGTILGYINSDIDVDVLSNASICEIMNYLLTIALSMSDDEVKALHNAGLQLTGTGPTLIQRMKSAQSDWDWGVLPFQEGFLLAQKRLVSIGSATQK
jgi:hypothetical protein